MIMIIMIISNNNSLRVHSSGHQQPKTYPHPRIPAARLLFVALRVSVFSSTRGNPEVGGGDNSLGSKDISPDGRVSWERFRQMMVED